MSEIDFERLKRDRATQERVKFCIDTLATEVNAYTAQELVTSTAATALMRQHRTLQQDIIRLLFGIIERYADAPADGRNQCAVDACKALLPHLKNLPRI